MNSSGELRINFSLILFSIIPVINLQLLDTILELSRKIVLIAPFTSHQVLKKSLFNTIAGNFDYSRKTHCLKWFLQLSEGILLKFQYLPTIIRFK